MTKKFHRLVVDDDQNMSKTLQDILWSHGYQTAIANTGAEALALAKKNNFACVLSDIRMPGMSGIELLQAFKEQAPSPPIILMTAYAPSKLLSADATEGVFAILNKSLDFKMLFMHLSALDKRKD